MGIAQLLVIGRFGVGFGEICGLWRTIFLQFQLLNSLFCRVEDGPTLGDEFHSLLIFFYRFLQAYFSFFDLFGDGFEFGEGFFEGRFFSGHGGFAPLIRVVGTRRLLEEFHLVSIEDSTFEAAVGGFGDDDVVVVDGIAGADHGLVLFLSGQGEASTEDGLVA